MAFKLEITSGEQKELLTNTIQNWSNCQPDIYMVSIEGHKIYTQRIILGLYCSLINELIASIPGVCDLPGISVPASSGAIVNLLKILTTGMSIGNNKMHLLEAAKTAEILGFGLENCQLGVKKKKTVEEPLSSGAPLNVQVLKRKVKSPPSISKKVKVEVSEPLSKIKEEKGSFIDGLSSGGSAKKAQKQFACNNCEKLYSSKQALQRHELVHSENPTPFECDKCDKRFDRQYKLEKHKKNEHGSSDVGQSTSLMDESEPSELASETQEESSDNVQEVADPADLVSVKTNDLSTENTKHNDELNKVEGTVQVKDTLEPMDDVESSVPEDNIKDPMIKEKLLADRQKLIEELNSLEGQGDLDFLTSD